VEQPAARRRPILKAALGGVVAIGAVGGAARVWPGSGTDGAQDGQNALALVDDGGEGISELEVPLDGPVLTRRADDLWETGGLSSTSYSMLALTWHRPDVAPDLAVRSRADGEWSDWLPVPALADRPDASSGEGVARGSTELMWIGPSDGVQVRVGGVRPRGLTLVLLQPWAQPGDDGENAEADEPFGRTTAARGARPGLVPRPDTHGRRQWGARESWRDGRPRYNYTIKQVHVHHTVNSNNYGRHDVPALLRGIYRYHTRYLGWSDIGYNFLVDRFGRIWIGRAGGASRPVRGAHTLGFNSTSAGVAVIGNFELVRPSDAVLDAVAAVAAWKLQPFHRNPLGTVRVWSQGSDRFRPGRRVRLPTIDGHRDTNRTACPGRHLYHHIPQIQQRVAALIERYSKVHVEERSALHGTAALGNTLTVNPGTYTPADALISYVWLRDDRPIPRAHGSQYVVRPADVGTRLSVRITARKPGLKPVTRRRWTKARTTGPSIVTVDARALDGRRLRVAVRVSSPPGVRPVPNGKVVVKVDGRRDVVRLTDGRGIATFGGKRPLARGRYWVKARYLGDRSHDKSHAAARVRVRR
jgi:hypothetical protein